MLIKNVIRAKGRLVLILATSLILVSVVVLIKHKNVSHETILRDPKTELISEIKNDSEIKSYIKYLARTKLVKEKDSYLESEEYVAKCQKGIVIKKSTMILTNGQIREEKRYMNINKYMEIWEKLQSMDIWTFENNETGIGGLTMTNYVRIGKREHRFEVGIPYGVEDVRYMKMQKIIVDFLDMGDWLAKEDEIYIPE